ncbi:hypothetical protein V8C86DRAFT_2764224 [Haematococcus lacustris]
MLRSDKGWTGRGTALLVVVVAGSDAGSAAMAALAAPAASCIGAVPALMNGWRVPIRRAVWGLLKREAWRGSCGPGCPAPTTAGAAIVSMGCHT